LKWFPFGHRSDRLALSPGVDEQAAGLIAKFCMKNLVETP
jgi:hypothetical protein